LWVEEQTDNVVECQLVVVVAVQTHWQVETLFVADSLTKLIGLIVLYCCYCEFQVVLFAWKSSKRNKTTVIDETCKPINQTTQQQQDSLEYSTNIPLRRVKRRKVK
jgi:hypothetical protein